MTAAFITVLALALGAVIAGGVIDHRNWRKTLDTPPVTGYTGTERRETMTKYVRPGKVRRFPDVYDQREVEA